MIVLNNDTVVCAGCYDDLVAEDYPNTDPGTYIDARITGGECRFCGAIETEADDEPRT